MIFSLLAEAPIDPTLSTIASLIGNLGSSGAAVVVTWFFLSFLRNVLTSIRSEEAARDQRYEELAERLSDRLKENSDAMREFTRSVNGICKAPLFPPPSMPGQRRSAT